MRKTEASYVHTYCVVREDHGSVSRRSEVKNHREKTYTYVLYT